MDEQLMVNNPLIKIALGLLILAGNEFKTVSIVDNSIIAGEFCAINSIRENLESYGWDFDGELNAWRFDMSQLEE